MTIKKIIKPKPIKTIEMETAIARYFGIRENIIVPNISWGFLSHEADMFIIKKSGYAVEVEIKITKQDLLADFKKGHNHKDGQNRISEFYYAMPLELLKKCKDIIPEDAGIITCQRTNEKVYAHRERTAKKIKNARKLTMPEQFSIARLGTLRIWTNKEKIIKLTHQLSENKLNKKQ